MAQGRTRLGLNHSGDEFEVLLRLEQSLWCPETRYNLGHQEKIFAASFVEFGRSGQRYTRAELISASGRQFEAEVSEFQVRLLSDNVALLTYVSSFKADGEIEISNRCSLWVRDGTTWQLHFHQGTPAKA